MGYGPKTDLTQQEALDLQLHVLSDHTFCDHRLTSAHLLTHASGTQTNTVL